MNNDRLGKILLQQGLIDSQQLDFCLSVQKNNGHQKLGFLLSHYDFVDEASIAKALAFQVGWEVFEGEYQIDLEMVDVLGIDFLIQHQVCPVLKDGQTVFVIARADDIIATDAINEQLNLRAPFYVGIESQLRKAIEGISNKRETVSVEDQQSFVVEDSVMKWIYECLNKAILAGASDIHIEPSAKVVEIRFRTDGILVFVETLPLKFLPRLVNVIFHLAEVTISDFAHFHDAKFLYKYFEREIDIRVSHIPSIHGSTLVLRLLDKGRSVMALSELGYNSKAIKLIQDSIHKPDGICLVVGPTGCGKTTTLYAILNSLKSIDHKILTIEDPVEIQLPLMTQVQINEKRGISFPQSVRAFLRHDPDIILIGEIRDQLTAQEALRAAMTGHQVFTTLHTNKAIDVFFRLHDLGIPFTHMADHISMIISQRLIRKLCPDCKTKGRMGCESCRGGYRGQTVICEVLTIDESIADFLVSGNISALKKHIKESNYQSMLDDARHLVEAGITSLQEVQRILG